MNHKPSKRIPVGDGRNPIPPTNASRPTPPPSPPKQKK